MGFFQNTPQRGWHSLPPATKNLLIINIGLWLICSFMPSFGNSLYTRLGLHYWGASSFNPIDVVSYMFLHSSLRSSSGIVHILFNMYALYIFGRILEMTWGTKRFLLFYLICGVGAGLVQEVVWTLTWEHDYISSIARLNGLTYDQMSDYVRQAVTDRDTDVLAGMNAYKSSLLTIGASGAIFGLLLGFGWVFPNVPMYLFFIPIPIKAKWLVGGYAVLELMLGSWRGAESSVAHFAHLGGMLFALIILLIWQHKGMLHGRRF